MYVDITQTENYVEFKSDRKAKKKKTERRFGKLSPPNMMAYNKIMVNFFHY